MAAPPPVWAGGFTRLSKGLAGFLFVGYAVTLLFPWTISYLALVPAKTFPCAWNIITAGYVEQSIFGLVLSILGLLFCGKLLEPIWTSREFLKFIIFVNTITLLGVYITAVTSYYITRREALIYTPLSGFHGVLSGFLVGVKLTVPDEVITVFGSFHMRAEWLPSLQVLMSIILSTITREAMRYLPFVLFGTYGSWLYLRYLQRNPDSNLTGNPGDEFAFATFFPRFIRPVINAVSSIPHKLLLKKSAPRKGDAQHPDDLSLPGFDTAEASRWRERASRALDERLQDSRNDDADEDHASSIV